MAQVAVALPYADGVADDLADPAAYSQQHAVDDAVAVLDAHSVGEAHVVGISMGGFAGLHLAMSHPGVSGRWSRRARVTAPAPGRWSGSAGSAMPSPT